LNNDAKLSLNINTPSETPFLSKQRSRLQICGISLKQEKFKRTFLGKSLLKRRKQGKISNILLFETSREIKKKKENLTAIQFILVCRLTLLVFTASKGGGAGQLKRKKIDKKY